MKKYLLITLFAFVSIKSYSQTDALAIISYMSGADAQKIKNTIEMTIQMKQGVEATVQVGKSIASIEDLYKQIELDARNLGGLEELIAKELDNKIKSLKKELIDDVDYLDLREVYMDISSDFRGYNGELNIGKIAANAFTTDVRGSALGSIAGQTSKMARDFGNEYNRAITNANVLKAARKEDIRQLQQDARSYEKQVIAINMEISLKKIKGGFQAAGGLSGNTDRATAAARTRTEVTNLIGKANDLMDKSNAIRRDINHLLTTPLEIPEYERQVLEKVERKSIDLQMTSMKELQMLNYIDFKQQFNGIESDYKYEKTSLSSNPFKTRFEGKAETINEIWDFFYMIKPILDTLIIIFSIWGMFNYSMALALGNDSTTKNLLVIIAGLIIWFAILPSFLPMLGAPI